MTAVDIEMIEHLDFSIELVCETQETECSNVADWWAHSACCKLLYPVCSKHWEGYIKWFNWAMGKYGRMRCKKCNYQGKPGENLYYVTPINVSP